VNPVFIAIVLEAQGGGSFMVLPHTVVRKYVVFPEIISFPLFILPRSGTILKFFQGWKDCPGLPQGVWPLRRGLGRSVLPLQW
jgi:hypothetical protein